MPDFVFILVPPKIFPGAHAAPGPGEYPFLS